jgi:GNAT superfamily N-acetyltransferase
MDMTDSGVFVHRTATLADLPALGALMTMSIRRLIAPYLDEARVEASFEIMGIDTRLIEDGTYFVVEDGAQIVGCGGWSRRATLFGGDHSSGRDARLLDPGTESARVRAMYTHPDFARRGIGRLVLSLCEDAAMREGFRSLELVATVAGEPLYLAYGFSLIERIDVPTSSGLTVPCARMSKPVTATRRRAGHQMHEYRDLLLKTYAAFNARDLEGALSAMHPDVDWPNGMEGGYVKGHSGIRDYWTRQWGMVDSHVEPTHLEPDDTGRVVVDVHQVVRDLSGEVLADQMVQHVYSLQDGLITHMEIRK